jgi:predicted DNA-binding transcriptional regulator AlpA
MKPENKTIKVKNIIEELYNKQELDKIEKELITFPQLVKILNKSRGSIYNLISNGTLTPIRFLNKIHFSKQQVLELVNPIQEQKKNTDWKLDKSYEEYFGIEEDKINSAKITDEKSGKQILQDNKSKSQNKPIRKPLNTRVKRYSK